ncbi:hypothetical protein [Thiohalophilus sp.]|uniref:hypothetical protein n=1 Tax=Thiohalophilus sp. TaxID=3028392 RepID=UPI002ACDAE0C|nr:hypothetical protein [Thiohalophilus sp.]MDZ7662519.1 hypothetical protein [Thiohalophilus sp.]
MGASYQKSKGRQNGGSFARLPHAIMEHWNFINLSYRAKALLLDLLFQYRGSNNGDLTAAMKIMQKRGWTSKDQLQKAKIELMQKGWIVEARKGGRNIPTLYALTFFAIDECGGKLDRRATTTSLGYWKYGSNPEI